MNAAEWVERLRESAEDCRNTGWSADLDEDELNELVDLLSEPSPTLLRAWASDPATMRATMGLKWGTYSVSTILIHAADALEHAEEEKP